jgi:aspartyl-tRNA(Asn)/glutamyl-tRNA(Gln) amidotransferase subunit C
VKVTENEVVRVAELAHLELTAEEIPHLAADLTSILEDVHRLNELDTSKVEPMTRIAGLAIAPNDALRDDHVDPGVSRVDAVGNAPESDGTYFRVPKVIER